MGWLWALGILTLLAAIPIGASVSYREEQFLLRLKIAWIPITIDLNRITAKKPKKSGEKPKKQNKEEPPAKPTGAPAPKAKKRLSDFKPLIRLAIDFLGDLRRKLVLDWAECNLILAGSDPCDLAVLYGSTWAAMGNLTALLEQLFVIRHRDIQVQCDFTAEKTLVKARLDLHMTLGRILALGLGYGIRALKLLMNMKNKKGGASK